MREARPADKGPLMEFIKRVWGGHDYIPYVWDDWMGARDAKMFVVLADGRQVGMNRVRFMEDGSAWFEGARVHPDFRGLGLATALGERSMEVSKERGAKVFRLTSGSWNKLAHHQIARMGFNEASRISVYAPSKGMRFRSVKGVRRLRVPSIEEATAIIGGSREFRLGSGVMWDTFAAIGLTRDTVAREIRRGDVYRKGEALAILKGGGERDEAWRQVCFLTGEGEDAVDLVRYAFGRKEKMRTERSLAYMPQGSKLIGGLRDTGFERFYSLILFERRAAKG